MDELRDFVKKWCHPDYPPEPVTSAALIELERELGVVLPDDYKSAILQIGLPSPTAALLSQIVATGVELRDLAELHSPFNIIKNTRDWRSGGLPKTLVVIGSDAMGNCFCFDENDLQDSSTSTAAIHFWDHDFDETSEISTSFSTWVRGYLGDWSTGRDYKDF